MSVESFTPTALQFTEGAAHKVKSLVDEEGNDRSHGLHTAAWRISQPIAPASPAHAACVCWELFTPPNRRQQNAAIRRGVESVAYCAQLNRER